MPDSLIVAAILVAGGFALPSPIVPSAAAIAPPTGLGSPTSGVEPPDHPAVAAADIVPGSVGRSSIALEATYDAYLKIYWGSGLLWVDSTATIRNTSGGAIDRVELNTIATRLGDIDLQPVTVDGATVPATISDQTIVVPLGGVLPAGGVDPGAGPLRSARPDESVRLELDVHQGERHPRPVSLAALGQPPDRLRPPESR